LPPKFEITSKTQARQDKSKIPPDDKEQKGIDNEKKKRRGGGRKDREKVIKVNN